ncbi:MAG TPA: glycerophosphodiester phosphodiesterase family protein, partial [Legionellaceae bacterium]|nr:glycerophosphodiester phosphodiesterase family protein [Legionellaceae bacterium]
MKRDKKMYLGPIIGHRGLAALAPENTLESFALAHQYGLKAIEFDVMLSADGEAFVFHDLNLKRTTNGKGQVGLVTAQYLKGLDAGSWFSKHYAGIRIPTLRETLLWLLKHQMTANIEIKPFPGCIHQTVHVVLDLLKELWPSASPLPLISSFETEALRLCRALHPTLPLGYLLDRWQPEEISVADALNCVSMHVNHRVITRERIQLLKKHHFWVYLYTVNHQSAINKYFAWGADGIFS